MAHPGHRLKVTSPKLTHVALDHGLTLKEAALQLGNGDAPDFDRIVGPCTKVVPHVATA